MTKLNTLSRETERQMTARKKSREDKNLCIHKISICKSPYIYISSILRQTPLLLMPHGTTFTVTLFCSFFLSAFAIILCPLSLSSPFILMYFENRVLQRITLPPTLPYKEMQWFSFIVKLKRCALCLH